MSQIAVGVSTALLITAVISSAIVFSSANKANAVKTAEWSTLKNDTALDTDTLAKEDKPLMSDMVDGAEKFDVSMSAKSEMLGMVGTHKHPLREVSHDLPVPTLTHLVFPDAIDGHNIQLLVEKFKFSPASINREVVDNEGHAHLYVNGTKVGRIYSKWLHLPSFLLEPGVNFVSVTLNANDHSEWAIGGTAISSTVRVLKNVL